MGLHFVKQTEFQSLISDTQRKYIVDRGWLPEWFETKWPHITKPEYEYLNLPDYTKLSIQDWEERHHQPFPWHSWHGIRSSRNMHSSQVLCLTIFGAFLGSNADKLEKLLIAERIMKPDETILDYDFEYNPNNYNEQRKTSVDFMVIIGRSGKRVAPIYFEVKFLEGEFGLCSRKRNRLCDGLPGLPLNMIATQCQLSKEDIRYWDVLPELLDLRKKKLGCPIQGHLYQLARNILHLHNEKGRALIVLSDSRTKYLDDEIEEFTNILSPEYQQYVHKVRLQQLLPYVEQVSSNLSQLLSKKYALY